MVPSWGDVPTWVASVGTVAAFGAAFWQIRTERRHRIEADNHERRERHEAQARLISAMPGPVDEAPKPWYPEGRTGVDCVNSSAEPVYNIVVGIVFIQGAAPRTMEGIMTMERPGVPGMPITTLALMPPGRSRVWIAGTGWTRIMAGRPGVEVAFSDRARVHWIRRANGALDELDANPFEYFGRYGLSGPYDLQVPESRA